MTNDTNVKISRKQLIIQTAYTALAESGFEGLRIRDIAQSVGINPATMYHYFRTKEELIDNVIAYVFDQLAVAADESPGTPKEQMHIHLNRLYRQMRNEPQLFSVLIEIRLRTVRSSSFLAYEKFETAWHAKLVKLLQTGIRQGYWNNYLDPESVATTVITLMLGAGLQAASNPRHIGESINQLEKWISSR